MDIGRIYRELFRVSGGNIGPRQADRLHIWEIGVLLGQSDELETPADPASEPGTAQVVDFHQHALARIEQRIQAAEGSGVAPESAPLDLSGFPAP